MAALVNKIVFECKLVPQVAVYRSGDFVTGEIVVEFSEATKVRGIDLKFLGQAVVHWTESKRSANDSRRIITKKHQNKETYFDVSRVIFGRAEDETGPNVEHPIGLHKYPFRFKLPPNLPATFDSQHGSVSYAVIGDLDIPWAPDRTFKKKFKVTSDLDLNDVPIARDALVGRDQKVLCCLCCKHGPITAEFAIPQAGFVPGETIYVNADVHNYSRRKVHNTEVKFKRHVVYKAGGSKTKVINHELVSIVDEEDILRGMHFQWQNKPVKIPKCPPSYLPFCSIIDIRYELVFNIDVAGTSIDMEIPMEIIIGTKPLKGSKGVTLSLKDREVTFLKSPLITTQPLGIDSPFRRNFEQKPDGTDMGASGESPNQDTEKPEMTNPDSDNTRADAQISGLHGSVSSEQGTTPNTPLTIASPSENEAGNDSRRCTVSGISVNFSDSGSGDPTLPAAAVT